MPVINATRIDELKARKAVLRIKKAEILAEMDAGTLVDKFPLFFCNEEIRSVNAQLRALSRRHAPAARCVGNGEVLIDRQIHSDWVHQDENEAIDEYHNVLKRAAREAVNVLTEKQAFYYARWADGISITDIAKSTGVDKSTVSRCISQAKIRIRQELELRNAIPPRDRASIDFADEDILRLILSHLSPHQAMYLYLYCGEGLSLQDCEDLLSVEKSTVYRTITRGLANICKTLHCQHVFIENIESIGDLAYACYVEHAQSIDRAAVMSITEWTEKTASGEKRKKYETCKIEISDGAPRCEIGIVNADGSVRRGMHKRGDELREPGKLLSLLIKSKEIGQIRTILYSVFKNLRGSKE